MKKEWSLKGGNYDENMLQNVLLTYCVRICYNGGKILKGIGN
jgi:hypothetical protein